MSRKPGRVHVARAMCGLRWQNVVCETFVRCIIVMITVRWVSVWGVYWRRSCDVNCFRVKFTKVRGSRRALVANMKWWWEEYRAVTRGAMPVQKMTWIQTDCEWFMLNSLHTLVNAVMILMNGEGCRKGRRCEILLRMEGNKSEMRQTRVWRK